MTEAEKRKLKLEETEGSKPAEYSSDYTGAISKLKDAISDRSFSYDPASDSLYRQYADRYIQSGKLAMMDTVGKSSALTGGYGNSYAHTAGQQEYDAYLQKLSEAGLDLYNAAYQKYLDEGDALQREYENLTGEEQQAYNRWKDAVSRWSDDRDYYSDALKDAEKAEREGRESAYNALYEIIIESGYIPTDDELEAGGMTREAAEALREAYLNKLSGKGGSSVSGNSSGKGSGSSDSSEAATDNRYSAVLAQCNALKTAGSSSETIASRINAAYSAGYITAAQRSSLLAMFG